MFALFDHWLVFGLGLGVLIVNVVGLVVLLLSRPVPDRANFPLAPFCRACAAEGLGTFALVFFGLLACIGRNENSAVLQSALTHGLTIVVCVAALGGISGGHFNPAVTLGMLWTKRVPVITAVGYLLAQLGSALLASGLIVWLFGKDTLASGVPTINQELIPVRSAFVPEAMATLVLVVVIFGTSRGSAQLAPVAIGGSVTAGILAIGPMTGAALNPARYLGPALITGQLDAWLVYTAGPILGAALAALVMHYYVLERDDVDGPRVARVEEELRKAA
jgi:MIP family channel proteins